MSFSGEPRNHSHRGGGSVVGPLILIGLGGIFLANNLGILSWDVWGNLWRFWPVILVLIGLEFLFGRRAGGGLIVGLVVIGVVAFAVFGSSLQTPAVDLGETVTRTFEHPLETGVTRGAVEVNFGAGRLNVAAIPPGGELHLTNPGSSATPTSWAGGTIGQMTYTGPASMNPDASYRVRNGVAEIEYRLRSKGFSFPFSGNRLPAEMKVELGRTVPLALDISAGAAETNIDLTGVHVTSLNLEVGASNTTLKLGEPTGLSRVNIEGGATNIVVEIPQNVAAQITFDGGLSSLNVDESRFPSIGNKRYRTPNYDSAPNKIDIELDLGAASATIR